MQYTHLYAEIIKVLRAIDDESAAFLKYFMCDPYSSFEMAFFEAQVRIDACDRIQDDLNSIPMQNGIYVFSLIESLSVDECMSFNKSNGTKIRREYMNMGLESEKILYIGSCKTMTLQSWIKEHVETAGKGVYSLRLFDEHRKFFANRVKIDCFALRNIDNREDVSKLVLPLIEEKLQKELKPACGRYRG